VQESRKEYDMQTTLLNSAARLAPTKWRVLDEDVFLSQLFRRATILDSVFHNTVLDIVCSRIVVPNSSADLNQSDAIETFFKDSDLYDTECILAEVKNFSGNEFPVKLTDAGAKAETQPCCLKNESNILKSMNSGIAADSGVFGNAQIKFDKFDINSDKFDKKSPYPEASMQYSSDDIAVNSYVPKASFGAFSRTKSAEVLPVASFGVVSSLNRKDALLLPDIPCRVQSVRRRTSSAIKKVSVTDFVKRFTPGFSSNNRQEFEKIPIDQINEAHSSDSRRVTICHFDEGAAPVAVHHAPVKSIARMREKLLEYSQEGNQWAGWPLTAHILDPIRTSIVCNGPSQILQVLASVAWVCS
jgi:hypothetical protein